MSLTMDYSTQRRDVGTQSGPSLWPRWGTRLGSRSSEMADPLEFTQSVRTTGNSLLSHPDRPVLERSPPLGAQWVLGSSSVAELSGAVSTLTSQSRRVPSWWGSQTHPSPLKEGPRGGLSGPHSSALEEWPSWGTWGLLSGQAMSRLRALGARQPEKWAGLVETHLAW